MWFQFTEERIEQAVAKGQWNETEEIAMEWADMVCGKFGLKKTRVWKFFKRYLVEKWFGVVENKRFQPSWSVQEALEYANRFSGRSVRFSLFPEDIACHAKSFRLPVDRRTEWESTIAQADNSVAMEMFPETSSENTICFRRYSSRGENIVYEASKGQAMFVFEQEQGLHPIVEASKLRERFIFSKRNHGDDHFYELKEVERKLKALIKSYDSEITNKGLRICRALGINFLSIEGYFDPKVKSGPVVVDLDLPFDYIFMAPKLAE